MSRAAQNSMVILAALGAALMVVQTQTNWLEDRSSAPAERERCFGVTREGGNDCATPKHSCAAQARTARDADEWIMLPKDLCGKLVDGRTESL